MRISNFWKDKDGHVVVWHRPNAPLVIWLVCAIIVHFLDAGKPKDVLSLIGLVALVIWALLEIFKGDSPLRRVLGGVVLAALVISRLK